MKKSALDKTMKRNKRRSVVGTSGEIEVSDVMASKAMDLRLQHKSYGTIGQELGISRTEAFRLVNHEHTKVLAGLSQKAQQIREEQNSAIDDILERWMPLALSEDLDVGEIRTKNNGEEHDVSLTSFESSGIATDKVLKALELKAKINGLMTLKLETKADPALNAHAFAMVTQLVASLKEKQANVIEV